MPSSSSSSSACIPVEYHPCGRQGIGVVQPDSGIDYPLVGPPSADIRYLLADMYLSYDDPADYDETLTAFELPFKVSCLFGLGCNDAGQPAGCPDPVHSVDIVITDANDLVVFDSTTGTFTLKPWSDRLQVNFWETTDAVLTLVTHTKWVSDDDEPTPVNYDIYIAPISAIIDERAIERRPKRVKSLTVILDNFGKVPIDWLEGFNINIQHLGEVITGNRIKQQVQFDAAPGGGLGRFPVCVEDLLVIRRINGASPQDNGDFLARATNCYAIRQPTTVVSDSPRITEPTPAMLAVSNDCDPCCPCDDYVITAEYMNRIAAEYQRLGNEAELVRDQYHVNRDRWNEAKCCFEQHPLRLVMQPQICPYIDVAGQFCNMTDECIQDFDMFFDFREEVVQNGPGSISASLSLGTPLYTVQEVPGFTYIRGAELKDNRRSGAITRYDMEGGFPQLAAHWDIVEPYQNVWVRFRLRIFPAADSSVSAVSDSDDCPVESFPVQVTLTAKTGDDFIVVPNCSEIPSEPICAVPGIDPTIAVELKQAVLNCPTNNKFFWDPFVCLDGGNC